MFSQIGVHSPHPTGPTEENYKRDEENGRVLTVGRPEHSALSRHIIQKQKHGDGSADTRHRSSEKRNRSDRFAGHDQVTEQGSVGNHHLLHEVKVRRGCAPGCYTPKKAEHFRREWMVARQLAEIGDEQNHPEIDA